ncbi:MAG: hypothetical protein ACRD3L_01690 [Terriglobales bacterium]
MSIAGILTSSLLNLTTPSVTSPQQSFQKEFQRLGQDLQAGNLSAAQADFATLQQNSPPSSAPAAQTSSPVAQAFSQLGEDLQSGNLSAAKQDFSTIQQDVQSQSTQGHHHHHHGGGGSSANRQSTLAQDFAQLSQSLRAGDLSAAQQAYSGVQQSFQTSGGNNAFTSTTTWSSVA